MFSSAASADPKSCQDVVYKYDTAIRDLMADIRSYAWCVRESRGHDDCSIAFSALKSAHSEFDDIVDAYEGGDCR
jgi:hypothetical protein